MMDGTLKESKKKSPNFEYTTTGNFRRRQEDAKRINFDNITNQFNLFWLMFNVKEFISWLTDNELLEKKEKCVKCGQHLSLQQRKSSIDGYVYRCKNKHEYSLQTNSFFVRMKYTLQDLFLFLYEYVNKTTLLNVCKKTGVHNGITGVKYAQKVREMFLTYVDIQVQWSKARPN